ncbi:MAG: response regulator [Oscillospiraceae bacterium]|jgi:putative two-component system response regulator|nr:response regulator [Oscillospiraceae bacterium]
MSATILLVDSDTISLMVCKAVLSSHYTIITANSGVQALGCLRGQALPDLILLGLDMPGMDGISLLDALKSQERTKDIPVVLCSAVNDLNAMAEAFQKGAVEFLQKPAIPLLLQQKVSLLLELVSLRRENARLKSLSAQT